jgi:DNA-binding response OmpR family regulator
MPILDGIATAKEIRELNKQIPILFLTAKSLEEDKLAGFAAGADDYLTKPFSMVELIARIEAISRRSNTKNIAEASNIKIGSIAFDAQSRILHLPSGVVKLTTKENQLLSLLSKNTNEIIDRQATLRAIWGDDNYFNGRSMDVYIAKLRKLLKEDPAIEIMNVHGKGFQLIVK